MSYRPMQNFLVLSSAAFVCAQQYDIVACREKLREANKVGADCCLAENEFRTFLNLLREGFDANKLGPIVDDWFNALLDELKTCSACSCNGIVCLNLPVQDIYEENWETSPDLAIICNVEQRVRDYSDPAISTDSSSSNNDKYFLLFIVVAIVIVVVHLLMRYYYCKRKISGDEEEQGSDNSFSVPEASRTTPERIMPDGSPYFPNEGLHFLQSDGQYEIFADLGGYAVFRPEDDDKFRKHYFQGQVRNRNQVDLSVVLTNSIQACLGMSETRIIGYADDKLLMHVEWSNADEVGLDVVNDDLLCLKFKALRDGQFVGEVEYRFQTTEARALCSRILKYIVAKRLRDNISI